MTSVEFKGKHTRVANYMGYNYICGIEPNANNTAGEVVILETNCKDDQYKDACERSYKMMTPIPPDGADATDAQKTAFLQVVELHLQMFMREQDCQCWRDKQALMQESFEATRDAQC